ncbi:MAG: sigma-70 family RNA polymerase sigma factor [Lutibacter sp.]
MRAFEQYTDLEVVQKIAEGEVELFEIIIRRYNPYLYKTGRSYNYSHEDTQDLMQDTYINAFINLSKFEHRSTFKTWIIKIMLNNCFRKRQKWNSKNIITTEINEKSAPMFTNKQSTDPYKAVINGELNSVIENALLQIPIDYRMVFSLREVNGLNVLETADTLNISEANVKVRLNRAKAVLRKEVEKTYSAEDIFEFNLIYCNAMVNNVMNKIKEIKL